MTSKHPGAEDPKWHTMIAGHGFKVGQHTHAPLWGEAVGRKSWRLWCCECTCQHGINARESTLANHARHHREDRARKQARKAAVKNDPQMGLFA